MDDAYKAMAEAHVANKEGTTVMGMLSATLLPVYGAPVFKWCVIDRIFPGDSRVDAVFYPLFGMAMIQLPKIGPWMLGAILTMHALKLWRGEKAATGSAGSPDFMNSLMYVRAMLMLLTVYSILAVDFTVYPEGHMKTEIYGISVMDVGVGAFVWSHGVVMGPKIFEDTQRAWLKWLYTSLPLCVCGLLRVAVVKTLGYQEHLTEYGVHWNFFFSLALVPVIFRVGLAFRPVVPLSVLATAPIALHQVWLTCYGGVDYMLDETRVTLVDQNKEGIFGLSGYVSLFGLGTMFGLAARHKQTHWTWAMVAGTWAAFWVTHTYVQPCSRRMCNAPYVALAASCVGTSIVLLEGLPDLEATSGCRVPPTERYVYKVSKHGFIVFLVCNLLTGAVNLAVRTLHVEPLPALVLLAVYIVAAPQLSICLLDLLSPRKRD